MTKNACQAKSGCPCSKGRREKLLFVDERLKFLVDQFISSNAKVLDFPNILTDHLIHLTLLNSSIYSCLLKHRFGGLFVYSCRRAFENFKRDIYPKKHASNDAQPVYAPWHQQKATESVIYSWKQRYWSMHLIDRLDDDSFCMQIKQP